jgi:hypothetical protein
VCVCVCVCVYVCVRACGSGGGVRYFEHRATAQGKDVI